MKSEKVIEDELERLIVLLYANKDNNDFDLPSCNEVICCLKWVLDKPKGYTVDQINSIVKKANELNQNKRNKR